MNRHHRTAAAVTFAALSISALAACGSDEAQADELPVAACDTAVDFGAAFAQAPDDPAEFQSFASETLVPLGASFVANLEGTSAEQAAGVLDDAFGTIASTGDPSALDEPATAAATATIGKAVHDHCDLQAVDIKAVEYAFVDAPDTLKAGRVGFALENTGVEQHEMVLFKRADGTTDTLDQILELPEDEMMSKMTFTGVAFGDPGTTNYVAMDLDPGTYFLLCFIPQGGGEDGPPHFMAGMKHTLEVS
jgi:hypothetical protein